MVNRWSQKIVAFLHDPPGKALVLRSVSHDPHAQLAEALQQIVLGRPSEAGEKERAVKADHIASAADRVNFPERATAYWDRVNAMLTHPLAAGTPPQSVPLPAQDLPQLDNEIQEEAGHRVLRSWITQLAAQPDSEKRLYFHIWRLLYAELARRTSLRGWVRLLPADTRQPDHPLEQHLSITAAIADALPEPAFLVFSIGPVQEFIAAARRTQDLWMGSWLLSYLTWRAIESLAEEYGPDVVVFPSLRGQPLCDHWLHTTHNLPCRPSEADLARPTFPNKFVALLSIQEAARGAEKAEKAVREEWKQLSEALYQELSVCFPADEQTRQLWEAQIQQHLEVYWVVLPWIGADNAPGKPQAEAVKATYRALLPPDGSWPFEEIYQVLDQSGRYDPNWGTVYSLLYDLADRAFNARKNLRNFEPVCEEGPKCTLCGQRAALRSKQHNARRFWGQTANSRRAQRKYDIKPDGKERLCAVCAVKRFVQREVLAQKIGLRSSFPSTSEISAATFKAQVLDNLDDTHIKQALQTFFDHVDQIQLPQTVSEDAIPYLQAKARSRGELAQKLLRLDGEYLFSEAWTPNVLEETIPGITAEQAQEGRRCLNQLYEAIDMRPKKYYAVLYMDGDQMGRWLSGTHEKLASFASILHPDVANVLQNDAQWQRVLNQRRFITPAVHAAISSALASFSLKLVRYVIEERYAGRVVYAGGDDVLALLPMDHVLPAARELRALFSGEVKVGCSDRNTDLRQAAWEVAFKDDQCTGYLVFDGEPLLTMGPGATASIGVAIAHHLQPLDLALQAARRAEHRAKQVWERNALAIEVLKRSGEALSVGTKWFYDGVPDAVGDFIAFCELLEKEQLSGRFPYAVHAVARTLCGVPEEAQKAELRRLIRRQAGESLSQEEKKRLAEDWSDKLMRLAQGMVAQWPKNGGRAMQEIKRIGLEEVAQWLLVCSFIVRGGKQ
ncbi:CRISPR-associated protein, Cmr2 family [Rhodothermus profundi]|uniref:CRISPR-associated protein, Cmr2 family n=2 Tax=Rhodothermus profundi TaxID=633813 RepID=A0A1M6V4T5_9BACT|nr:CRISPR-associated protein, Cmr2 family [Rhodothermus profundi]